MCDRDRREKERRVCVCVERKEDEKQLRSNEQRFPMGNVNPWAVLCEGSSKQD